MKDSMVPGLATWILETKSTQLSRFFSTETKVELNITRKEMAENLNGFPWGNYNSTEFGVVETLHL